MGLVEDRPVRVVMELEDPQYQVAVQAHGQGQTVLTTGTLAKEGCGFVLKNPAFLIVEAE